MGLDIIAYSNLKKVRSPLKEPFELFDGEDDDGNTVTLYVDSGFPGRADEIENEATYSYEGYYHFKAGSYSGYNHWREQLAELGGYTTSRAWKHQCANKPFIELVDFSDCEGTIGAKVSKKLARDFAHFDQKAKKLGEDFYESYRDWRMAFDLASDNGAVHFC